MNRSAESGPNLTWIFIATAAFVTVVTLLFQMYTHFSADNSLTIDSDYANAYQNITASSTDLDQLKGEVTLLDNLQSIIRGAGSTLNGFLIGLASIAKLLKLATIIPSMLSTVFSTLLIPAAMVGFITLVIIIYIAMEYIRAARGTIQKP